MRTGLHGNAQSILRHDDAQRVISAFAGELGSAEDGCAARGLYGDVVTATIADDQIAGRPTGDAVVAGPALKCVVTIPANQDAVAVSANEGRVSITGISQIGGGERGASTTFDIRIGVDKRFNVGVEIGQIAVGDDPADAREFLGHAKCIDLECVACACIPGEIADGVVIGVSGTVNTPDAVDDALVRTPWIEGIGARSNQQIELRRIIRIHFRNLIRRGRGRIVQRIDVAEIEQRNVRQPEVALKAEEVTENLDADLNVHLQGCFQRSAWVEEREGVGEVKRCDIQLVVSARIFKSVRMSLPVSMPPVNPMSTIPKLNSARVEPALDVQKMMAGICLHKKPIEDVGEEPASR